MDAEIEVFGEDEDGKDRQFV
ncbi:MAG: hypothetical protein JWR65_408, partial [Massilia sp.]|nr:hypothetical protein [Massilia sp.]